MTDQFIRLRNLLLICFLHFSAAAQQPSEKEQLLETLKESGLVRQEGNKIYFKVKKASDTPQIRLLYGNLFASDKWTVGFDVEEKQKNTPSMKPQQPQVVPRISNPQQTPPQAAIPAAATACGCMSNMELFAFNPTDSGLKQTRHVWTVPAGVNKIKIEAWSAGGDGWSVIYEGSTDPDNRRAALEGGGGGGGAYLLTTIPVKPGDKINMSVPAGGSNIPLTVQLNDRSTGGAVLESGHNAEKMPSGRKFDGKGGRLGAHTGVFATGLFSINGQNGEQSYIAKVYLDTDHRNGFLEHDTYDEFYGAGGDAPRGGSGGAGLKMKNYAPNRSWTEGSRSSAEDGIEPGGGGGSGYPRTGPAYADVYKAGKGAAGLILIYY